MLGVALETSDTVRSHLLQRVAILELVLHDLLSALPPSFPAIGGPVEESVRLEGMDTDALPSDGGSGGAGSGSGGSGGGNDGGGTGGTGRVGLDDPWECLVVADAEGDFEGPGGDRSAGQLELACELARDLYHLQVGPPPLPARPGRPRPSCVALVCQEPAYHH